MIHGSSARYLQSIDRIMLMAVAIVAVSPMMSSAAVEPYDLNLIQVYVTRNHGNFLVADFDGDSQPEFLELSSDRQTFCIREFSSTEFLANRWLHHGEEDPNVFMKHLLAADVDGERGDELISLMQDISGDSAWIRVTSYSDEQHHVICKTKAIIGSDIRSRKSWRGPGWDGELDACYAVDLENDGDKELVAVCAVGFDCYPRGLFVYDFPSGDLIWSFPTASNIGQVEFADADGDGESEVYLGTYVTANGCFAREVTDNSEFLYAVDYNGDSLWAEDLGGSMDFHASRFAIADGDGNGTIELYMTHLLDKASGFDEHVRKLSILDLRTSRQLAQHSFDPPDAFGDLVVADLDLDGTMEVLTNNGPTVLDGTTLNQICQGESIRWRILGVVDIDGDTTNGLETVLRREDSLVILDRNMKPLVRYTTDGNDRIELAIHFANENGEHFLGVVTGRQVEECFGEDLRVFKIEKYVAPETLLGYDKWRMPDWFSVSIALIIGAIAGVFLIKVNGRLRTRFRRSEGIGEYDSLLDSLATFEHGQSAGRNLERIEFLLNNLPPDDARLKPIVPRVMSALETYSSFTSGQLRDVVERSARCEEFAVKAADIHNLDLELTAILSEFDIADPISGFRLRKEEMIDLTVKLKQSVRDIRIGVMSKLSVDLVETVNNVIGSLSAQLKNSGISITKLGVTGDISRAVFFSRPHLVSIIEEIFSNASASMRDSSVRNIGIAISIVADTVALSISDTGGGILAENAEVLFDREYSTKQDKGGYGLFYVRQQIERFGGKITIRNNNDRPGATVTITMKLVPNE